MIMKFISSSTPLKGLCSTMKRQLISRWGLLFQQIIIWQSKGTKSCTKFKIFQMAPSNLDSTHWSKAAPRFRKNVRKITFFLESSKLVHYKLQKVYLFFQNILFYWGLQEKVTFLYEEIAEKNTFECFSPSFGGVFVFWKVLLWSETVPFPKRYNLRKNA